MPESRLDYRGQTTLPKAVRNALGLKVGDRVRYVIINEGVLMMPVHPTSRLFGSLEYDDPPVSLQIWSVPSQRERSSDDRAVGAMVTICQARLLWPLRFGITTNLNLPLGRTPATRSPRKA